MCLIISYPHPTTSTQHRQIRLSLVPIFADSLVDDVTASICKKFWDVVPSCLNYSFCMLRRTPQRFADAANNR